MLNHRRQPRRPRSAEHDPEQLGPLLAPSGDAAPSGYPGAASSIGTREGQPARAEQCQYKRRGQSPPSSARGALALPMDQLGHSSSWSWSSSPPPHRNGHSTSQLSARYSQPAPGQPSPSSSINFSDLSSSRQNFIFYTVQPGDTLQNLSVKYSCPVASIKRINNLWSDQEFHALTRIKLPVGRLRLIADVIAGDCSDGSGDPDGAHSSGQSSTWQPARQFIGGDTSGLFNEHATSRTSNQVGYVTANNPNVDNSVFKELDSNIEKARNAARFYDNHASAILQSLGESGSLANEADLERDPTRMARREAEALLNDMTEFQITYNGLILFIFIVCLIFPLGYVIYLEETHHAARHET